MTRHLHLYGLLTLLILLAEGRAWGHAAPPSSPSRPAARPLPKLAVAALVQEPAAQDQKNIEDLLTIELGNQPFLQLVDRQALQAVMKEHAIVLSNQMDPKGAMALGKFAGADYLLYVLVVNDNGLATQRKAMVRLVEAATGQVRVNDQVALSENLALSLAAVREKVLAAVRPESQAVNRLTVGIAALPNRSGTDRSDKLGIELQKALRTRLSREPWAVVLEREYPRVLLDELELGRAGIVGGKTAETLPPADFVLSGAIEDVGREYEAGRPWKVRLDLTLRLRGHRGQLRQTFRSDAIEAAANELMPKIEEFRRQPASQSAVPEKELWRRQAMYLMPRRCETWAEAIVPNFSVSTASIRLETIRAWENVLVLDGNDWEAMTNLGICLIGFDRWYRGNAAAAAKCVAGSQLVERAAQQTERCSRRHVHRLYRADARHGTSSGQGNGSVRRRSRQGIQACRQFLGEVGTRHAGIDRRQSGLASGKVGSRDPECRQRPRHRARGVSTRTCARARLGARCLSADPAS